MQPIAKYTLTAVTHCEVNGVGFEPGDTFDIDSKDSADYLVEQGAAVYSGGEVTAAEVAPARTTRSSK